jgi:hypothetical protein
VTEHRHHGWAGCSACCGECHKDLWPPGTYTVARCPNCRIGWLPAPTRTELRRLAIEWPYDWTDLGGSADE